MQSNSGRPGDYVEQALDALRREWRNGFNGRALEQMAAPMVRRLAELAPTQQTATELAGITTRFDAYHDMPIERRKEELIDIAARLKRMTGELEFRVGELAPLLERCEGEADLRGVRTPGDDLRRPDAP